MIRIASRKISDVFNLAAPLDPRAHYHRAAGDQIANRAIGVARAGQRFIGRVNCGRGETGRRAGLKIPFRKECRFEPDRPHHPCKSKVALSIYKELANWRLLLTDVDRQLPGR